MSAQTGDVDSPVVRSTRSRGRVHQWIDSTKQTLASFRAAFRIPHQLYSPLDVGRKQFRLLIINPDRPQQPLRCHLRVFQLGEADTPEFETCSYVWGDPSIQEELLVDGHRASFPVSSVAFLRRLRLEKKPRIVWIDAICINQQNFDERSGQVSMMGDIYRGGKRNVILMCHDADYVRDALDSIASLLEEEAVIRWLEDPFVTADYTLRYESDVVVMRSFNRRALLQLLHSSWFSRVWTFQEAILAKENLCYCGCDTIDLASITKVASWALTHERVFAKYATNIQDTDVSNASIVYQAIELAAENPASQKLSWYTGALVSRQCSLPVDKVFGILGLLKDVEIRPDYTKTTAEVYQEFVKAVIRHDKELAIMTRSRASAGSELPSWVPDFNHSFDHETDTFELGRFFHAGYVYPVISDSFTAIETSEPSLLSLEGFALGSICKAIVPHTYPAWAGPPDFTCATNLAAVPIDQFRDIAAQALISKPHSQEVDSALALTLCAERDHNSQRVSGDVMHSYQIWKMHLENRIEPISRSESDGNHPSDHLSASQYAYAVFTATRHRSYFVTSNGRIGLCPRDAKEGDHVVILYGLQWPAVMRRKENRWLFIGIAYVHGVMFGEAIDKDHRNDEVFVIE